MSGHDKNDENQDLTGLYEKLATKTVEQIDSGKKTIGEALSRAREEMKKAGEYSSEQIDQVTEFVSRDVFESAHRATEAIKDALNPQRMYAGAQSLLSRMLTGTADTLSELAQKTEKSLEFKTGEVTSAGTLVCKDCGAEMHLKNTARIPPCAKCHKTLFRKQY